MMEKINIKHNKSCLVLKKIANNNGKKMEKFTIVFEMPSKTGISLKRNRKKSSYHQDYKHKHTIIELQLSKNVLR